MSGISKAYIRWMIRSDIPAVCRIEAASFEHPWTEEDFLRCLRSRNCIGVAAEYTHDDGFTELVGFTVYGLRKCRLELLKMAVVPHHRRVGCGRAMCKMLVHKTETHRRRKVRTCVREGNLPAQLFFRRCGFKAVEFLPGYFEDTGEAGIRMEDCV